MNIEEFDYDLPAHLIAQVPLASRGDSRLLVAPGETGEIRHLTCREFPQLLRPGDVVVVNDTRVIPARLQAEKPTGGKAEIFLERILDSDRALVQLGANKKIRQGQILKIGDISLEVVGREDIFFIVRGPSGTDLERIFLDSGEVPLPPYIERAPGPGDTDRYQTVYADRPGAVAAPTAGLHLDQEIISKIRNRGVEWATVTLHVGAGTFRPVKVSDISEHAMHNERIIVPDDTCRKINTARAKGGRVVAVGTTVVRTLESIANGDELQPFAGETELFITPGYDFRVVDAMLTNFHLPRSTLLMMVSAFAGHDRVMACYRAAVESGYRFFSYGDAMFLERNS